MKKKTLTLLLTITTIAALTACGQPAAQETVETTETVAEADVQVEETQEATPEVEDTTTTDDVAEEEFDVEAYEEDLGNAPSNNFEDRVGKVTFESYDEIIGLLNEDEAYAFVNVKGYDGEVLLISDATYDDLLGHIASTDCSAYSMKADGTCTFDSILFCGGTATPITIDEEGVLYTASEMNVDKSCYGDNGTENPALMYLASVTADELDDNGEPVSVGGFVRNNNSLVDDDGFFLRGNEGDIDIYKEIRDAYYNNTQVINFTRIDGTVAQ